MIPSEQKKLQRQAVLAQLRAIPAHTREEYSARLRGLLSPYLEGVDKSVALYCPLPHEVNLLPLPQAYPQHRFAFPRCMPGRQLQFHHVSDPCTQMEPGAMGIPAPALHLPIIEAHEFDIVVVPGVAFTRAGARLGYGGGYYDRYLPRCTKAQILALAFPEQMVAEIATEAHDLPLPLLITL
ncbi:MAG: 5-formyltetrahydrofolate cyclo-ligase [Akkermansia sp.]|nr:5-formyltetrahydrofolate cyclo-ligase [Akkermansia sp.]